MRSTDISPLQSDPNEGTPSLMEGPQGMELEAFYSPDHGYVSATACRSVFAGTDYTRIKFGNYISESFTGVGGGALLALESEEIRIRQKLAEYLVTVAQKGSPEAKLALAKLSNVPDAADRMLASYLGTKAAKQPLYLQEERDWELVKTLEPFDFEALFGDMISQGRGGTSNLLEVAENLTLDPVLSKIPFLDGYPPFQEQGARLGNAPSRTHDMVSAVKRFYNDYHHYRAFNDVKISFNFLGAVDWATAYRYRRESDGEVMLGYLDKDGTERVETEEYKLSQEWIHERITQFFESFGNQIDFHQWKGKDTFEFYREGLDTPDKIFHKLRQIVHGELPLTREENLHYGKNFPLFSDLKRLSKLTGVTGISYPYPGLNSSPLVEQIETALNIVGYGGKNSLNDARLKPLRDIMHVLHAVKARGGAFGDYLGEAATPHSIAAANVRAGKKAGEEGFIPPEYHTDSIVFNGQVIKFDFNALDHAIEQAKEAVAFCDKRLGADLEKMLNRLRGNLTHAKTKANDFIESQDVEVAEGEFKNLFHVQKRAVPNKTVYELDLVDTLIGRSIATAAPQAIRAKKNEIFQELKALLEDSPYCENVKPALVDGKLLLTNPPSYIGEFLNHLLAPAKGIEEAMEELGQRVSPKKFQLGKVVKDPIGDRYTVTLINPVSIHPREKDSFFASLTQALQEHCPDEGSATVTASLVRGQHLAITNAPEPLIHALQTSLGISAGKAKG